jgi:hypothetical protein
LILTNANRAFPKKFRKVGLEEEAGERYVYRRNKIAVLEQSNNSIEATFQAIKTPHFCYLNFLKKLKFLRRKFFQIALDRREERMKMNFSREVFFAILKAI